MASQLAEQAPLFEKTASAKQTQQISNTLSGKGFGLDQAGIQQKLATQGVVDGFDFSKVGTLTPEAFKEFMLGVPAATLKKVRGNFG
jgi:hypothetical protein